MNTNQNQNQNYIPLNVVVASPCSQDWNAMTAAEQGRFCASCSKTVYDFTDKSKQEISQFFAAHKDDKVCGRFRESQVMNHQIDRGIFMDKLSVLATRSFRRNIVRYSFLVLVGAMLSLAWYQPGNAVGTGTAMNSGSLAPKTAQAQYLSGDTTMLAGEPVAVATPPDTATAPEQAVKMMGTISVNRGPERTHKGKPGVATDGARKHPRKPKRPVRPACIYMMGDVALVQDTATVTEPVIKGEVAIPVEPTQPIGPIAPVGPVAPVGPAVLFGPVAPVGLRPVLVPTLILVPNAPGTQTDPPVPPVTHPVIGPVIH